MNISYELLMWNNSENLSAFEQLKPWQQEINISYSVLVLSVCCLGLLGNILGILLIRNNKALQRLRSNVFLTALSACSCIFLMTVLLTTAEQYTVSWKPYSGNSLGCKLFLLLAHSSDFACSWLVAVLCADRLMLLLSYKKSLHFQPLNHSIRAVALIILISSLCNLWVISGTSEQTRDGYFECMVNQELFMLYSVGSYFETIMGIVLPSLIVIFSNVMIIWKLKQLREEELQFEAENGQLDVLHTESTELSRDPNRNHMASFQRGSINPENNKALDTSLVKILLLLTFTFVLLNFPNYLYRLSHPYTEDSLAKVIVQYCCFILYYCHHAVLFYVYIFNSSDMRKQLKPTCLQFLECYCLKPGYPN